MSKDYSPAVWMPHSHYWHGRSGHQIKYIIIHGTASPGETTAEQVARYFQTTQRQTGSHFIVGRDGEVIQCCDVANAAWGNGIVEDGHEWWWGTHGNPNLETISIEFVKPDKDNALGLTPAQQQAGFDLIDSIVANYSIPPRWADEGGGITGHYSISPVTKRFCPGPFPWDELFAYLNRPIALHRIIASPHPVHSVMQNSTLAAPVASPTPPTPSGGGQLAHTTLQELPGFSGIVGALNQAERFQALPNGANFGDTMSWVGSNAFTGFLRFGLVIFGVLLVFALIAAMVKKNIWMGQAGLDTPALLFHAKGM